MKHTETHFVGVWPTTSGAPYYCVEFVGTEEMAGERMDEFVEDDLKCGISVPYFVNPVSGNKSPQVGDCFYPTPGWDGFPAEAPCWFRKGKLLNET